MRDDIDQGRQQHVPQRPRHDTLDVETDRLRALGFDSVEVVMTTERDRPLLYARQSTEA